MKSSKVKVIGTNSLTKHLEDEIFDIPYFGFGRKNLCFVDIENKNGKYTFELKLVRFEKGLVILDGFIAMPNVGVGRISLKYLPKVD